MKLGVAGHVETSYLPTVLAVLISVGVGASPAAAQSVEQFYKGRQMTMVVGTAPGGINDISARFAAKHLGRFIPGNPTFIVQNMPGAGGISSANRLYNVSERDGSVISKLERAVPQLAIQGDPNVNFDPRKFTWLGSLSSYAHDAYLMLIMATNSVKSVEDLKKPGRSITLGGDNSASSNLIFATIAKEVLGLNINIVRGYTGAAPMFLAMQRGEIDGQIIGFSSVRTGQRDLWTHHAFRPLMQFGRTKRLEDFPDIPTGREMTNDKGALALMDFAELPIFPVASVRGAARHSAGSRQGAADGVHGNVQGQGCTRRGGKAWHRDEPDRRRRHLETDRERRRNA